MHSKLRQLKFPKEFRISPPVWSTGMQALLEQAVLLLNEQGTDHPPETPPDKGQLQLLRDVSVGLWRIKQKMVEPKTEEPLPGMARAFRHLQSTWDALSEAGIEIQDHTGTLFDSGLSLSVVAFQPTPGITREKIIETVKPSIYFNNERIQMGEVIVGTPENSGQQ